MVKEIQTLVEKLGVTEEQAKEILACDKEIDKGKPMPFDLPPEKEKIAKKYRNVGGKHSKSEENAPKKAKNVKISAEKVEIVAKIAEFLQNSLNLDTEITNPSREIKILTENKLFSLTLVEHRSKK